MQGEAVAGEVLLLLLRFPNIRWSVSLTYAGLLSRCYKMVLSLEPQRRSQKWDIWGGGGGGGGGGGMTSEATAP